MTRLAALALLLPLAATAADDDRRQFYPGFSLVPPAGKAWALAGREDNSLLWVRDTGDPDSRFTFAVVAGQAPTSVRSQADLVAFLERLGAAPPPSPDLELEESTAGPVEGAGPACARHDAVVRDRASGAVLTVAGVTCLHPDYPGRMFDVQYSRRGPADGQSEALDLEGEALIRSFRFEEAPADDDWSLSGEGRPPHPGG